MKALVVSAATPLAVVVVLAPASGGARMSAAAAPGASYYGHSSAGTYARLVVSGDGTGLAQYSFVFQQGRCSDGRKFASSLGGGVSGGGQIGAAGAARYSTQHRSTQPAARGGGQIDGVEHLSVTVQFNGDTAAGTLRDAFSSRRLRCSSGPVAFTVARVGTGTVRLSSQLGTTGLYVGKATAIGSPAHPFSVRLVMPWRVVTSVQFAWDLPCEGKTFHEHTAYYMLPLKFSHKYDSLTFGVNTHGVANYAHNNSAHWKFSLDGEFWEPYPHRYEFDGTMSYQVDFDHGRTYTGTCIQSVSLKGNTRAR